MNIRRLDGRKIDVARRGRLQFRPSPNFVTALCGVLSVAATSSILLVYVQCFQLFQPQKRVKSQLNVMPLSEDKVSPPSTSSSRNKSKPTEAPPVPLLLDFNASGSIGSLLMQMLRREEEMRKLNKTLLDKDLALDLDPVNSTFNTSISIEPSSVSMLDANASGIIEGEVQEGRQDDLLRWMRAQSMFQERQDGGVDEDSSGGIDAEKAKELDDAVSVRLASSVSDITVLDLQELYQVLTSAPSPIDDEEQSDRTTLAKDELPRLSRPEHYEGRIGRDVRHLAVSIASCVDDVAGWRLFCQQSTGGLMPLVQCIREGAKSIREGWEVSPSGSDYLVPPAGSSTTSRKEESFLVASNTCRALRDLCALSPDLAVVITDGLLRANTGYENTRDFSLMDDLCTLLRYADDFADVVPKSRKQRLLAIRRRRRRQAKAMQAPPPSSSSPIWPIGFSRARKEARLQCKLYVTQLLLCMTCASDSAVDAIRSTEGLQEVLLVCSSYARKERRRRWIRYPGELVKDFWLGKRKNSFVAKTNDKQRRRPFIQAASPTNDLNGRIQANANQVLASIGYNEWVPKIPGQKGLRILCLDGGGSRGMTAVMACKNMVDSLNGLEIADGFDLVVGTSTGAIIAFLVGLNRETSDQAVARYDVLIEKIFTKSAFSAPMLLFTTASYDESPFMNVLSEILGDNTMLDSRADPAVPYVFAVTSKMSSTPTHVALFRNYNYNGNELPDPFMIDPDDARERLGLFLENEADEIRMNDYPKRKDSQIDGLGRRKEYDGSRHPGSFRVLQRYALRASTAAPTVFKPVMMGGEMYCDGGIVASNPTAIAIHEARNLFPDVPIELVVSMGTGGFLEQKSEPRIGWDGIIGQIVNSATDGEQIHHILEDILGDGGTAQLGRSSVSNTRYMRFNPTLGLPVEFPIDVTDPEKLRKIKRITTEYMQEPEQQRKLQDLSDLLKGRSSWFRKWIRK